MQAASPYIPDSGMKETGIQKYRDSEGEAQPSAPARWTVLTGKDAGLC